MKFKSVTALLLTIICILLSGIVISSCVLVSLGTSESTSETSTEPSSDSTTISDTTSEDPLPDNVLADCFLARKKTLEVTGTQYILTVTAGATQITTISRSDASVQATMLADTYYEVKISDKTGQTITINLTKTDYQKFLEL